MKVSWIKLAGDKKNFRFPEMMGFDVFVLKVPEDADNKIDELIAQNYNTIIISKDLAGFSEKINTEYANNKKVDIIINKK